MNTVTLGELTSPELAPFDVHLITVNVKDEEAQALTEKLEVNLMDAGYEVLTDDRNERVGVKFSDSDLIGCQSVSLLGKKAADGIVEVKIKGDWWHHRSSCRQLAWNAWNPRKEIKL